MKATFEKIFHLIAPKFDKNKVSLMAEEMNIGANISHAKLEEAFLAELLKYKIAQLFDDKVSLEDIVYNLRNLVIDNHINVSNIADDIDEDVITDDMLRQAGNMFKKNGWLVCDFNEDPKIYHLSVIPSSSKNELDSLLGKLGLYVQYF
jgi:hypothetical protein